MNRSQAEAIAAQALNWVAADADRLGAFMAQSGADPAELRQLLNDPVFLGFVLDFLLSDDQSVIDFATEYGMAPDLPLRARRQLPGGDNPDWT